MVNLENVNVGAQLDEVKKAELTKELVKDIRKNIGVLYNKVTAEQIAKVALNDLRNNVNIDQNQKIAIIKDLASGKVQDMQIKLGMKKTATSLKEKADNLFGKRTLKNLEKGGLLVSSNAEDGIDSNILPPRNELSLTKDKYLDLLKPKNADQLLKTNPDGTISKESILYTLRTLTVSVSKDYRGDIKTDTLTFDFNTDVIMDTTIAKEAFTKVKSILNAYASEPTNIQIDYTYEVATKTWKKVVVKVRPANNPEDSEEALVKTTFYGYEDIEEYLDSEVVNILPDDISDKLDKRNIQEKEINGQKTYSFGDTYLIKKGGKREINISSEENESFRRKDRKKLSSKLILSTKGNTLEDCFKLMAFIDLIGITFKGKTTGADKLADIEGGFGWDFVGDNNPFYVRNGILYFSDEGSLDDYDLLEQENLEDMVSGVSLKQLAELFTSRVAYKFEG